MGPFLLICDTFTRHDSSFCSASTDNVDSFLHYFFTIFFIFIRLSASLHLPRKLSENTFRLLDKNESRETMRTDWICLDRVPLIIGGNRAIRSLTASLRHTHKQTENSFSDIIKIIGRANRVYFSKYKIKM